MGEDINHSINLSNNNMDVVIQLVPLLLSGIIGIGLILIAHLLSVFLI